MTQKELQELQALAVKVDMLHAEITTTRHLMSRMVERVTALEKLIMFFKGATAVLIAALSYVVAKIPIAWGL